MKGVKYFLLSLGFLLSATFNVNALPKNDLKTIYNKIKSDKSIIEFYKSNKKDKALVNGIENLIYGLSVLYNVPYGSDGIVNEYDSMTLETIEKIMENDNKYSWISPYINTTLEPEELVKLRDVALEKLEEKIVSYDINAKKIIDYYTELKYNETLNSYIHDGIEVKDLEKEVENLFSCLAFVVSKDYKKDGKIDGYDLEILTEIKEELAKKYDVYEKMLYSYKNDFSREGLNILREIALSELSLMAVDYDLDI